MRPLILHPSALTNAEYSLYLASLRDLADNDVPALADPQRHDHEHFAVGVREARAWLRGRYAGLAPGVIDSILRLFCPALAPADLLTGGQFFAVLRLVHHALAGKDVDSALVFVQAHPDLSPSPPILTPRPSEGHHRASNSAPDLPTPDANVTPNPFFTRTIPATPSPTSTPAPPAVPPKPSTNPFLARRSSEVAPGARVPSLQSRARSEGRTPPLPPRKPTNPVIPPPRHAAALAPPAHPNLLIQQSLQATRVAQSLKKAEQRLEQERVLEVLKSSSAHGGGRRTRSNSPSRAYDPRDGAASESAGSGDSLSLESAGARGARTPSLPPRRKISPPASTLSGSTSRSLEQVARASVPFRPALAPASAFKPALPPAALADLPADPPPTHPDRKPSLDAERPAPDTPRMFRSKSMHHASPPPPPPAPPARKRRPESVQLQLGPAAGGDASPFVSPSPSVAYFPSSLSHQGPGSPSRQGSLSRHHSLSSSGSVGARAGSFHSDGAPAPLADLRRTLSSLHQRAAPRLDSARYKAEAAFTPRGFVQHAQPGTRWMREDGEESLIEGDDDSGLGQDDAAGVDRDVDVEEYSGDESELSQRLRKIRMREGAEDGQEKAAAARRVGVERDELKWPAGDGWERL
ncbi:hypothetical protein POSPLADRAFT_1055874 [Postia placenta MAD-698-R-SB12]|uniref:Uncharacterized protein n=1 Tax=Postia placenta MAD-698-R-SB12 TaxID=670580 RepID=A0A1X6N5P1_9APHY|nr:hypothetical protein POSPLADRAFT_1055874 [Postia placenta MAD-698-R-SB12]OSX63792.1 hypothetical protein POSPLADRAFT_1055874 [Postia placenta MAD-698-R-SB12]